MTGNHPIPLYRVPPHRQALCPKCGQSAVDEIIHRSGDRLSIWDAHYLCALGHGWITRWSGAA